MKMYKQVIVLNQELEMSTGKKISQACHASLHSYQRASERERDQWENEGSKKVVLKSDDLELLKRKADGKELPCYLVRDAGMTELEPGSVTALGIGPAEKSEVDSVTGELELVE